MMATPVWPALMGASRAPELAVLLALADSPCSPTQLPPLLNVLRTASSPAPVVLHLRRLLALPATWDTTCMVQTVSHRLARAAQPTPATTVLLGPA